MTLVLALAAAPVALAVLVACVREPMRVALPIFAALIPFGGGLAIGSSRFGSLSTLAGAVLGVGLASQLITSRRSAPALSTTVPIWLLFMGAAAATVLWTVDRPTTVRGVIVLATLVLVYVFVAMSRVDRGILRRTENGLLVGAVASVCYGLYQLIFWGGFPSDAPTGGSEATADGRFGNDLLGPGVQAVALTLPLAIALSRAFQPTDLLARIFNGFLAAMMLCGILMTGARAGTLAAGIVVVTLAFAGPRRARRGLLVASAVGIALAALVWVYHPAGIATRSFDSAASSSGRADIWLVGLVACSEHCGIGAGWGAYPAVYAETQALVPGARVLQGAEGSYQPHNLWLLAAVELGFLGLVLLALAFLLSIREALQLPPSLRGAPLSALLGLVFAVFFLSSMEFKFFWMVLIMVVLNYNLHRAESERTVPAGDDPGTVAARSR